MGEAGLLLDAVLMLLLVAALAFGVRLEKKLSALRAGQAAFAAAVGDLNQAATRAEAALASLRAASQETDLLHDRIVKARTLKAELEGVLERHGRGKAEPAIVLADIAETARPIGTVATLPLKAEEKPARDPDAFTPVLQALAANHAAQQSLNRARRSLDEDLFAA